MSNRFQLIALVVLGTIPGCLHHGYYPNGYYGNVPSVVPAQPWPGSPNGPGFQPGGPVYQSPGPTYQPGGTYPTPINNGDPYNSTTPGNTPGGTGQPTFSPTDPSSPSTYTPGSGTPGSGNSAPPFNPSTPGGVPTPIDDGNQDFNRGSNRNPLSPTSSASSPQSRGNASGDLSSPFERQESRLPRQFDQESAVADDESFSSPVIQTSGSDDQGFRLTDGQQPALRRSEKTYAHDPKFAWVQGTVEYDEPNNTWVIMYDDNPQTSDPYGGEFTIAGNLSRYRLRPGDVVRVDGGIDPLQEDSRGKPMFQATKLQKF